MTKQALEVSLKKLLLQKPLDKITINNLTADCGISRMAFYYHFEDIYALLKWTFEQETMEVIKHFNLMENYEEAINFIMDYIEENDYIINCACDSISRDEVKHFFYADFLDLIVSFIDETEQKMGKTLEPSYKSFLSYFYMEALTGMLLDWIRERNKRARSTVVRYICSTMQDSLTGILDRQTYDS